MLLSFLPSLAPQILLNNFLSDIPAITIASDNVDPEVVAKPHRWNTHLLVSTLIFIGIALVLPYPPFISVFGFVPLPAPLMLARLGLTALYVLATELTKKFFYSRLENAIA
jgi:hypothetical protein